MAIVYNNLKACNSFIYDHREDSVFATKSCQYTSCKNPQCDGSECYTSFAYSDFEQAETYFINNILFLVENVKLDRPADSLPPLTRSTYVAQQADWGESEDAQGTSWNDQEQLWQEDTYEIGEEEDRGEEDPEAEDDGAEEAYGTHMGVNQENQPHSEEEDNDSYE
jgi:hypothetical protein